MGAGRRTANYRGNPVFIGSFEIGLRCQKFSGLRSLKEYGKKSFKIAVRCLIAFDFSKTGPPRKI